MSVKVTRPPTEAQPGLSEKLISVLTLIGMPSDWQPFTIDVWQLGSPGVLPVARQALHVHWPIRPAGTHSPEHVAASLPSHCSSPARMLSPHRTQAEVSK
jgi:hypothetical protein